MLLLRHSPLGPLGGPQRKPAPLRGASRIVTPEALLSARAPVSLDGLAVLGKGLFALVLLFALWQAGQQALPLVNPQVSRFELLSDSPYILRGEVEQHLQDLRDARYFSVDIDALRTRLDALPWVAGVEVRRQWPDLLEIRLTGQLPLARWGEGQLLNSAGELFSPGDIAAFASLPQLVGPSGHERELMDQYHLFTRLLRPTGLQISRLELRERGSWFVQTRQGVELLLGRDHLAEKMRRLVRAWQPELRDQISNIARVDLRYSNGLAVAWREGHAPALLKGATR